MGQPPCCELKLKADSDNITPPDLALGVILSGIDSRFNKLQVGRAAKPLTGQLHLLHVIGISYFYCFNIVSS